MSFSIFGSKKKNKKAPDTLLALDIGTEFVKVIIYKIIDKQIEILSTARIRQQPDAMKGAMIINIRNVIENCRLGIDEALQKSEIDPPDKVILGIAGELVQGMTIGAKMKRPEPSEQIDKDEIQRIIGRVREGAFDDALEEVSDKTGIPTEQIEEIDTVINDTYIDGFRVSDPFGFQGSEIKFKMFSTFAPSIHANSLRTLATELGYEVLGIVAEPYAITRSIHGSRDDSFGAIIIDIGGGTTDVAIVQRGGIVGTQMYAFGGRVFTKRIEHDMNLDYRNAEEMKLKYSHGDLDDYVSAKVKASLLKDIPVWIDGLELALSEFDDVDVYPSQFLLCGGGSLLAEIKDAILEYPWMKHLPFNRFPKAVHLLPESLDSIVDTTHNMNNPADIASLSLARYSLDLLLAEKQKEDD